jgi:hypothetical protein
MARAVVTSTACRAIAVQPGLALIEADLGAAELEVFLDWPAWSGSPYELAMVSVPRCAGVRRLSGLTGTAIAGGASQQKPARSLAGVEVCGRDSLPDRYSGRAAPTLTLGAAGRYSRRRRG